MSKRSRALPPEQIQARASRLAVAAGARNGALLAAADVPSDEGQTTAELWLYGVVGGYWWGFNDKTVADQLRGLNVDHITVRINSPGGDAVQGIAIGNLLRNHKASVTVVVDGIAASAASIIAIAGDEVIMSPGSQMMVHDPWIFTIGNARELRQDADWLDKQAVNLAGVYAHEAGGTVDTWRAVMTADPDGTWYTADEAVTAHLATSVGTVVAISAAPEPPPVDLNDEDDEMAARAAWDLDVLISPAARAAWPAATPKPPSAPRSGNPNPQETESAVAFSDEQMKTMRAKLELPDTADEAAILAAVNAVVEDNLDDRPPTPVIPDGMTLIEKDVLDGLRDQAGQGVAARQQQLTELRDRTIQAAITDGKITPARKAHWQSSWDKDPEGAQQTLADLPAGLIPVAERGHDQPSASGSSAYDDLYGQKGA